MGLCTSQNLTHVLLKLRPRTSHHHVYFFTNMHVLSRDEVCTSLSRRLYFFDYIFYVLLDETFDFIFLFFSQVHGGFMCRERKSLLSRNRYVYFQSNNCLKMSLLFITGRGLDYNISEVCMMCTQKQMLYTARS
jgi:hypothetical protein